MARPRTRVPVAALCACSLTATATALDPNAPNVLAYNYLISVGTIALVAVYLPLHAVAGSAFGRFVWLSLGMFCAVVSASAAFWGASLGGVLWQSVPTGIFMLFLALLIALQIAGGWHVVQQRARAPGRISLTILEDRHWKGDVSKEEYNRLVSMSTVSARLLRAGSEADHDAVAVVLARMLRRPWSLARAALGPVETDTDAAKFLHMRHEPNGLVLLGSIKYAPLWLKELMGALQKQPRTSLATFHHICVAVWWIGMLLGALAKTGFIPVTTTSVRSEDLRTAGIWLQALLQLIAVYAFPYMRNVVRYGMNVGLRLIVMSSMAIVSLVIGVTSLIFAREDSRKGNLIAYAFALLLAATAASAWSIISVTSYRAAVRYLLARPSEDEQAGRRLTAYLAALITRPRHGYRGTSPVLRWGDMQPDGRAALEIPVDSDRDNLSSEGPDDRTFDAEAGAQWNMLEAAAGRRW